MKVAFSTILVVGAAVANAIAVAEPETEARKMGGRKGFCGVAGTGCARDVATCGIPGNACARLKRSAEAVADAFAIADPTFKAEEREAGFCGVDGMPCAKARRSIEEVGEAVEEAVVPIYEREAEAVRKMGGRKGFCGVAGTGCARRLARDARKVGGRKGFCGVAGTGCAKRDADAEAEAVRRPGFCGVPGTGCAKKREADAEARKMGGRKGFCGVAGTGCAKVKRDAEARKMGGRKGFCGVAGTGCAKRDAEAEAARKMGGRKGFCGVAGTGCAKRDIEEQENVARSIDSVDPHFFKAIRDAEDGEGTALRAAHSAFMEVKREAEALAADATPFELLHFCDTYDCDEETVATIAARAAGTFDEREAEACNLPGGACDVAKRQLDDIEAKLTAAVEAL